MNKHNKAEYDKKVVSLMIGIYCRKNHNTPKGKLCPDCQSLDDYARLRTDKCPHLATKTFCQNCKTHCYKADMREKIRQVMRFSGPRMLFYTPFLAIKHLILVNIEKLKLRRK